MIKVGKRQKLVINNFSNVGAYLFAGTDDDKDNILLPNNEIEGKDLKEGDEVEVLIYRDSEDRLIATFRKTEALIGTLAKLEVVDNNPKLGAFMDWGLNKDLMLPNSQKETKVEIGKKYLVGLYEDSKGRISATMKIYKFLMPSSNISKGDIVNATVYRITDDIGVFVAVEDRYFALIPKSECYDETYNVGDELVLRVIRVREDGKIDLSPKKIISEQMEKDAEKILSKMKILKDKFLFNDESSPEDIKEYFGISKKAFKRAIGNLLKNGHIEKKGNYFIIKK